MSARPEGKRDWSGPISLFVLALLFLLLVGTVIWCLLPAPKNVTAFGEAFGGVAGTVISSLALVLLVFTVLQQQRALSLQREDLAGTNKAQNDQIEVAQLAARLNAATALLNYYQGQITELVRDRAQKSKLGLTEAEEKFYSETLVRFSQARQAVLDEIDFFRNQLRIKATAFASTSVSISTSATADKTSNEHAP